MCCRSVLDGTSSKATLDELAEHMIGAEVPALSKHEALECIAQHAKLARQQQQLRGTRQGPPSAQSVPQVRPLADQSPPAQ